MINIDGKELSNNEWRQVKSHLMFFKGNNLSIFNPIRHLTRVLLYRVCSIAGFRWLLIHSLKELILTWSTTDVTIRFKNPRLTIFGYNFYCTFLVIWRVVYLAFASETLLRRSSRLFAYLEVFPFLFQNSCHSIMKIHSTYHCSAKLEPVQ